MEPGLPGSTAASPYGPTPTVDKATHPSHASAGAASSAPDEPVWVPGTAGGFEDHEPSDRPGRSTDRWREAKLAAERERIAREAGPEERSPLERARRRLERLVGGGQDHDDEAAADREAAERARRARLGMDDDDYRTR